MMTCAFFALLNMIDNQEWQYIILPIGILIWGFFKFFDENDREYLRRNGIDPDKYNAFFPDMYDYPNSHHRTTSYPSHNGRREGNTITWDRVEDNFDSNLFRGSGGTNEYTRYQPKAPVRTWQDQSYKGMVKKCKRNFKITVEESEKKNEENKRKSFFPSNGSFGW